MVILLASFAAFLCTIQRRVLPARREIMSAIIRHTKTHIVILCPLGHLVESTRLDTNFAGSMIEAELGSRHSGDRFDRLAAMCKGHGHPGT
jgi:hypothetical protein